MKHFLTTRFNLRHKGFRSTKAGDAVRTDEWHDHRFELFETYCLPSVKQQTESNFEWFVYFDLDTSDKYRKRIDDIAASFPRFRPFYIDGNPRYANACQRDVLARLDHTDSYVITTRMDNDDILHKDFVRTIQAAFVPVDKTIIDVRRGYQVSLLPGRCHIREYQKRFNPFISLIERTDGFGSVLGRPHFEWAGADSVVVCDERRLWIELVHDQNLRNDTNTWFKRVSRINGNDFALPADRSFADRPLNVCVHNLLNVKAMLFPLRELAARCVRGR